MLFGMNRIDRMRRDLRIWELHLLGLTYAEIASMYDLTEDRVGQIVRAERERRRNDPEHPRAWELFLDHMVMLEAAAEQLALIALTTRHDGVRLGAISKRISVMRRIIELQWEAGMLPRGVGKVSPVALQRLGAELVELAERLELPYEVIDAILTCVASWVNRETPTKRLRL